MARAPGSFRHVNPPRTFNPYGDPLGLSQRRVNSILASIQEDIGEGCTASVRQILQGPRELFRLELERPDLAYQRTTILDRDTLTTLLEQTPEEALRKRFRFRTP